jgi:DNA sulfur modification protein DndD
MLIKSLKMQNFRQFKGITAVDFSCDPEQNVTIILGDNTFGKTTLLQAFNWCFYETVTFDNNPDFLLNLEVANEMNNGDTETVSVEICVIHNGVDYVISRSQTYSCANGKVTGMKKAQVKVSYKQEDGQMESVRATEVQKVIENILPQDLSTYFFFDTERVRSISTRKDVADAVKGLLGLSIMDTAIKHIGTKGNKKTVLGKLYGAMDLDGDEKARGALDMIQSSEAKREAIKTQIDTCASQIGQYEVRKEQLDDILRDNQTTATLQKKKEDLERRLSTERSTLESTISLFFKDFSKGSLQMFAQPLLGQANDFLAAIKIDDKGVRDLTAPTILELLKRGRCICGTELCEGNDAYNHLMEELNYVPPESIGNTVRHYREKLSSFSRDADHIFESLTSRYQEIYRSKARIQEWEDELADISIQIKGKDNMKKYETELIDVKSRLRDLNAKKERLIRDDATLKSEIERYKKVYDSLIAVSGKNKETMLLIKYAEEILDWLSSTYKEKEAFIREALEMKVNNIFEQMYHGHRRVSIDQKYQVTLLTTIEDKEVAAGESEGSNRVKSFAFIAGLVALAKEKLIANAGEEGFNLSSEPYPLVMDAPFSNADETHTANISKVLPEIAEQVIMFVMQKDWRYAEPVMATRVGKQYELKKLSETHTVLQ